MSGHGFIAVHVGAGYHSPANSELYKQVCRTACHQALEVLKQKKCALDVVTVATMALEDSPWTNAGTGSNLTITGQVECDASIMDGDSLHYGAVGAISGVKNPICVAENLLKTQMQGAMSLGRIPPSTLVGPGAREWAKKNNIPVTKQEDLLTDASKRVFIKNKRKLDLLDEGLPLTSSKRTIKIVEHTNSRGDSTADGQTDKQQQHTLDSGIPAKKLCLEKHTNAFQNNENEQNTPSIESRLQGSTDGQTDTSIHTDHKENEDNLLDTVGAICVDEDGNIASAVSSGGIVLKQSGRLGQAALYGCGCWAEGNKSTNTGLGISTSGCGEHLTKTLIARECAESIHRCGDPVSGLADAFRHKFLESHFLQNLDQKLGGALAVKSEVSPDQLTVEVLWVHTTDSMCLAYMSTADKQPKAFISRLPEGQECGKSFLVQSKCLNISKK